MDNNRQKGILYIVVPCFNEEEALAPSAAKLLNKLHELKEAKIVCEQSRIVFVDDGSKDRTWDIIKGLYEEHEEIKGEGIRMPFLPG